MILFIHGEILNKLNVLCFFNKNTNKNKKCILRAISKNFINTKLNIEDINLETLKSFDFIKNRVDFIFVNYDIYRNMEIFDEISRYNPAKPIIIYSASYNEDLAKDLFNKKNYFYFNKSSDPNFFEYFIRKILFLRKKDSELLKTVERLGLAQEAMEDGLWDYNIKTGKVYYSPSYFTMLGYTEEEARSNKLDFMSLLHPDDVEAVKFKIDTFFKDFKYKYSAEFRMRTKAGGYIWIFSRCKIVQQDNDGKPLRLIGIHINIDAQKNAVMNLQKSEEKYKTLYQSLMDGFVVFNNQGCIIDFNKVFADMIGYEDTELCNLNIRKISAEKYHEIEEEIIKNQVNVRGYSNIYEKEYIAKNGDTIPVEFRMYLFEDSDNCKYWAIVRDISERKKQEQEKDILIQKLTESIDAEQLAKKELREAYTELQLKQEKIEDTNNELQNALIIAEQSSFMKSEFLNLVSHEIKTPLHSILGYTQLLLNNQSLDEEAIESIEIIDNSGEKLLEIINDILLISAIESDKLNLDFEKFEIESMVDDILALYKDEIAGKNLEIKLNYEAIEYIYSDQRSIGKILHNLINNAIKFTKQGNIELVIYESDNFYNFEVKDTGIGIEKENFENIFSSFTQIEKSITRKYSGIGLGLTVCKKLVEMLNGEIWVHSEYGKGSAFYFKVPVKF